MSTAFMSKALAAAEISQDLQHVIRETLSPFGRKFDPDILKATYTLFTRLHERAARSGRAAEKDVAYGPDQRQRLDVFLPQIRSGNTPVAVYFHGGGYIGGNRSPVPGLIYDNVAAFFARNGLIGVNATYRLAPQHRWPSGGEDVGLAVDWLHKNAERFGGDPNRIFLVGQSAGGTHVATWTLNPVVHGPAGPRIAGAVLLSPVLAPCDPDYNPGPPPPHRLAYFGSDEARWDSMNVVRHVAPGHPPFFFSVAEFEPPDLQWSAPALVAAMMKTDRQMPWFRYLRGHNHVSPAMQIGLDGDTLGSEIVEFIHHCG
jgi:triacylglycerol lipase